MAWARHYQTYKPRLPPQGAFRLKARSASALRPHLVRCFQQSSLRSGRRACALWVRRTSTGRPAPRNLHRTRNPSFFALRRSSCSQGELRRSEEVPWGIRVSVSSVLVSVRTSALINQSTETGLYSKFILYQIHLWINMITLDSMLFKTNNINAARAI